MDNFEKVEKLRERANVSYEDAKQALENNNWDILDAVIYLEKEGKIKSNKGADFTTETENTCFEKKIELEEEKCVGFGELMKKFGKWCKKWIDKANRNDFRVEQKGKELLKIPVTLLVIFLLFAFWVVLPLLVTGLFFDMRYSFVGPDVRSIDIDLNKAMDSAATAAETIKNEVNNASNNTSNNTSDSESNNESKGVKLEK